MNNRRKELMLASAREYCKCIVEGKTIKYNQKTSTNNISNESYYGMSVNCSNGIVTITGTSTFTDGDITIYTIFNGFVSVVNHKYISLSSNKKFRLLVYNGAENFYSFGDEVFTPNFSDTLNIALQPENTSYIANGLTLNETITCMVIDLTELGLDNVNSVADFFATDLGKYVKNGNYLPFSSGDFIHSKTPIHFKGVNIWNEHWKNGIWYEGNFYLSGYEDYVCSVDMIKVKPDTQYFYFNGTNNFDCYIVYEMFDENKNYIARDFCENKHSFRTSNNCKYILFYVNDTYGNTYQNNICINEYNENYNGKYQPYCGGEVLDKGFALQKGDYYKTYSIDEISYNNLIPNANQDYVNSNTDSASANAIIYGANGGIYWDENLTSLGFYSDTFESNTTELVNIYMSGNDTNLYFATDIQMTSGHKYYISFNVLEKNASAINGLRIANLHLIDLTQLGLSALTDKLRIFLQKNYKLPYTLTNKTIKDQIVRTMKEIDLSTLTWTYISPLTCHTADLDSDLTDTNAITEKYNEYTGSGFPPLNHFKLASGTIVINTGSSTQPSGKALIKLLQPTLVMWQTLDIENYNEFVEIDPHIFKLNRDLSDYGVLDVTSDTGTKQPNLTMLNIGGANGDFCYQDGYIYQKTNDIESVWIYQIQISNAPSRMVSRRTINVESENGIDMDFTKE